MQGEAVVGFSGSLGKEIVWIGGSFKFAVDFDGMTSVSLCMTDQHS